MQTHIPQYSEKQNRDLQRVLGTISAAEQRTENHYKRLRKHARKEFQGVVLICLTSPSEPVPSEDHPGTFPAWAYSLSPGGVGFVAAVDFAAREVAVGLRLPDGSLRWMTGRVVRHRPCPGEEFCDYGVAFIKGETAGPNPRVQSLTPTSA